MHMSHVDNIHKLIASFLNTILEKQSFTYIREDQVFVREIGEFKDMIFINVTTQSGQFYNVGFAYGVSHRSVENIYDQLFQNEDKYRRSIWFNSFNDNIQCYVEREKDAYYFRKQKDKKNSQFNLYTLIKSGFRDFANRSKPLSLEAFSSLLMEDINYILMKLEKYHNVQSILHELKYRTDKTITQRSKEKIQAIETYLDKSEY
jgi:hypothetical protein